jgi:hypothetical protein
MKEPGADTLKICHRQFGSPSPNTQDSCGNYEYETITAVVKSSSVYINNIEK